MPDSALQSHMFCQRETLDLGFLMQLTHTPSYNGHTNVQAYLFIYLAKYTVVSFILLKTKQGKTHYNGFRTNTKVG